MARINIIPPQELTDQHLIAEYREITMIPGSLNRTLNSKVGFKKERVGKVFTLNRGHVYFFYDKGKYLNKRYDELVLEMIDRGFNPNPNRKFPKDQSGIVKLLNQNKDECRRNLHRRKTI